jgi:hypothetical protein
MAELVKQHVLLLLLLLLLLSQEIKPKGAKNYCNPPIILHRVEKNFKTDEALLAQLLEEFSFLSPCFSNGPAPAFSLGGRSMPLPLQVLSKLHNKDPLPLKNPDRQIWILC